MTKKEAAAEGRIKEDSMPAVIAALSSSLKEQQLNFLVASSALALEKEFSAPFIRASQELFPFVAPGKASVKELDFYTSPTSSVSDDFGFIATRPVFPVQFAIDRFQKMTVAEYLGISSQLSALVSAKGCFSCPTDGGELLPPFNLKPYPSEKELEVYDFDSDCFLALTVEVDRASQEFSRLIEVSGKEGGSSTEGASIEGIFRRFKLDTPNLASEIQRSVAEAMSQWGSKVFLREVSAAELEDGSIPKREPLLCFRYSWQCSECGAVYPKPAKAGAEVSLKGMKFRELLSSRPEELAKFLEDYRDSFSEHLLPLTEQLGQLKALNVSLDYQLREIGRLQQVAVTMLKLSNLSMSAGVCLLEFLPAELSNQHLEQQHLEHLASYWKAITDNENTLIVCVTEKEFQDLGLAAKHSKAGVIKLSSSAEGSSTSKAVRFEEETKQICLGELYELIEDGEPLGLTAIVDTVWHSPEFLSRKKLSRLASMKVAGLKLAGTGTTSSSSLVEPSVVKQTGLLDHLAALFSRTPEARTLGLKPEDFLSFSESSDKVSRAGLRFSQILDQAISSISEWSGEEYFCELLASVWSEQGLGALKLGEDFFSLNYRLRCQLDLAGLCLPVSLPVGLPGGPSDGHSIKSRLMLLKDYDPGSSMILQRLKAEGLDYSVLTRVSSVVETSLDRAKLDRQGLYRFIVSGL